MTIDSIDPGYILVTNQCHESLSRTIDPSRRIHIIADYRYPRGHWLWLIAVSDYPLITKDNGSILVAWWFVMVDDSSWQIQLFINRHWFYPLDPSVDLLPFMLRSFSCLSITMRNEKTIKLSTSVNRFCIEFIASSCLIVVTAIA